MTYTRRPGANGHNRRIASPRTGLLLAAATAAALIVAGLPARAADPANGERLAQRWCAACHVVSRAPSGSATDQAPPFATVARTPGLDAARIALFLLNPHPKMPDMGLTRAEAADLAAYIVTLK